MRQTIKKYIFQLLVIGVIVLTNVTITTAANLFGIKGQTILNAGDFKHYVDYFNRMEDENIIQAIPNSEAWDWMKNNIPLFECPQDNFEEMYYLDGGLYENT